MGGADGDIAAFYAKLTEAWAANDGTAFAALYTEDGSLINPFGERADGRPDLGAMYDKYFSGMLKGTTTSVEVSDVRMVGGAHALVDAEQTVYAGNGDVVLAVHVVNLMVQESGEWQLVDSRPYGYLEPPPG